MLVLLLSRFLSQSMEMVGINDSEIHNYQINLKESGSSRITSLTSDSKNGAKFRHEIYLNFIDLRRLVCWLSLF